MRFLARMGTNLAVLLMASTTAGLGRLKDDVGDEYVSLIAGPGGRGITTGAIGPSGSFMVTRAGQTVSTSLDSLGNQYEGPVWISMDFEGFPPTAGCVIAFDDFQLEAGACPDIVEGPDNPGAALYFPDSPITVWTDAIDNWNCDAAFNILHDEYLAVWQNNRATRTEIYARRVNGEGNLLSWFSVVSSAGSTNWEPSVAFSTAQEAYLIAYTSDVAPGNWDIYARRIRWERQLDEQRVPCGQRGGSAIRP